MLLTTLAAAARSGLPGTYYDWTGATLPSPWDTLRRAGLGTRIDAAGAVGYGAHNLLRWSDDFSNAVWTAGNGLTKTATTLTFVGSFSFAQQDVSSVAAGLVTVRVRLSCATGPVSMMLRLTDATDGNPNFTSVITVTTTPTDFDLTGDFSSGFSGTAAILLFGNGTIPAGTVIQASRAQLNSGATATSFVPTTTAPVYLPRPTHDPSTLAALGILVEGQATNLAQRSEDITTPPWQSDGAFSNYATSTRAANTHVAPDGTMTADTVSMPSLLRKAAQRISVTAGSTYTYSQWFRCLSGQVRLQICTGNSGSLVTENAVRGDITGPSADWVRQSITITIPASGVNQVEIGLTNVSGVASEAVMWGAQFETGAVATSYIPNPTTGTALRQGDFAGGGISGAALTALLTPTAPFTIVLPFRKGYTLASVETLLGLCAGASAGTTNQLGIATQGTQAQIVHSGGSGALTGTLSTTALNRIAVSVDPTWRGPERVTNGDFSAGTTGWTAFNASSSIAVSGGRLTASNIGPGVDAGVQTAVSGLTPGRFYLFSITITANTSYKRITCYSATGFSPTLEYVETYIGTNTYTRTVIALANLTTAVLVMRFAGGGDSAGQTFTIDDVSLREAGAASISVNGATPVETTGIAYTGAGTTALILGARDSSGGQPATAITSPGIRVVPGQYITGSALQALST